MSVSSSGSSSVSTTTTPFCSNCQATAPADARLPPILVKVERMSETVRFLLSVRACSSTAVPPGPYPSYITSSMRAPSESAPVARLIARSMLDAGMLLSFARWTARRRRKFASASGPPSRAAMMISFVSFVKSLPRRASVTALPCLIVDHLE